MAEDHVPDDRELAELEALLGDELRAATAPPAARAPEEVDRAVLAVIGQRAAQVRRRLARRRRRLWPVWTAAAALLLAAGIWALATRLHAPRRAGPGDIDGSGTVDIVDAYLMARRMEAGEQPDPGWDFNSDGRVDRGDVNALAGRAVSVSRKGS